MSLLPGPAEPRKTFGEVKIESSVPGRVEAAATSTEGGLLVLHDSYYPGWMPEVDGKSTPIRRADLLFRAIEVPPGTHRVTFRFAPIALAKSSRRAECRSRARIDQACCGKSAITAAGTIGRPRA
jgi:hypothetical protein